MPSVSESQARLMAACDHGADYASCPPKKVSHEFNQADKGSAMLRNAMRRVKRPMGGPVNSTGPMNPALLQALQARAAPNLAGISSTGMPPGAVSSVGNPGPMMRPPMPPPSQGMPMMSTGTPMAQPSMMSRPPGPPSQGMPMMSVGQGMPMMSVGQGMPPSGGALGTLQPPMGHPGPIGPPMMRAMPVPGPTGRPMMARGGLMPPGAPPMSPLPQQHTSPLSSLIGGGMAGMHGGPGLAPHMRKPRIPLPGALRNINQTINNSRQRLGKLGPV